MGAGEVAQVHDRVLVRQSEDPNGPHLSFSTPEWDHFVGGVKAGEFEVRKST